VYRTQANLETFPTTVKVLVEFRDVRILAFGVVNYPMSSFYRNHNAHMLLSPPDLLPVEGAAGKSMKFPTFILCSIHLTIVRRYRWYRFYVQAARSSTSS
jgi:hypothetical protein